MTPDQRDEVIKQGLIILKAVYDSKEKAWKIMHTSSQSKTGWMRYGQAWYTTKINANMVIDMKIREYPEIFVSDEA